MNWYKKAKKKNKKKNKEELKGHKWMPVNSSWITHVAYYEPMGYFEVKLQNGKEYTFKDVPKKIFTNFMNAKSKGEFFNRVIKDEFGIQNN